MTSLKIGDKATLILRRAILEDKVIHEGLDVIQPTIEDNLIWLYDAGTKESFFANRNGRIIDSENIEVVLEGEEDLRENILCRIFDYFLIKMGNALEYSDPNKGSCV